MIAKLLEPVYKSMIEVSVLSDDTTYVRVPEYEETVCVLVVLVSELEFVAETFITQNEESCTFVISKD